MPSMHAMQRLCCRLARLGYRTADAGVYSVLNGDNHRDLLSHSNKTLAITWVLVIEIRESFD